MESEMFYLLLYIMIENEYKLIQKNLDELGDNKITIKLEDRLEWVKDGERDIYF